MHKLDRYVAKNTFYSILVILAVLVLLESLIAFFTELGSRRANYQLVNVISYIVMVMPTKIYNFLSVSCLIGCLVSLGNLAKHSELVVMRTSGISVWRITWLTLKPVMIFIIVAFLIGEYVIPQTKQQAETQRKILRSEDGVYHDSGFWYREKNRFIYIYAIQPDGVLLNVNIYDFDGQQLVNSTFAQRAVYKKHFWQLQNVKENRFNGERFRQSQRKTKVWATKLTPHFLQVSAITSPESLSLSGLLFYTDYLKKEKLSSSYYELEFWQKVLQPLSIIALVLIGASMVFGPLRSVNMGLRMFSGIIIGVVFIMVRKILNPLVQLMDFPPILSVLIPIVLCAFIGIFLLKKTA